MSHSSDAPSSLPFTFALAEPSCQPSLRGRNFSFCNQSNFGTRASAVRAAVGALLHLRNVTEDPLAEPPSMMRSRIHVPVVGPTTCWPTCPIRRRALLRRPFQRDQAGRETKTRSPRPTPHYNLSHGGSSSDSSTYVPTSSSLATYLFFVKRTQVLAKMPRQTFQQSAGQTLNLNFTSSPLSNLRRQNHSPTKLSPLRVVSFG